MLGWESIVSDGDIQVDARRHGLAHVALSWDVGNNWFGTVVAAFARRMAGSYQGVFGSVVVMATALPSPAPEAAPHQLVRGDLGRQVGRAGRSFILHAGTLIRFHAS